MSAVNTPWLLPSRSLRGLKRAVMTVVAVGGVLLARAEAAPFADLSDRLPVAPEGLSGSFADYDNDGWPDLLFKTRGRDVKVIHNEQGEGFALGRGFPASIIDRVGGTDNVPVFADYDNDGDQDVFLAGGRGFEGPVPDALLRSDGGNFVDVADSMGLVRPGIQTLAAVWLDANQDGWLDLYTSRFIFAEGSSFPPQLFQNLEGRSFVDVTNQAGLERPMPSIANGLVEAFFFAHGQIARTVSGADFTNDGAPDLLIGAQNSPTTLLVNDGNGVFFDETEGSGLPTDGWMVSGAVGDIDNDGDLDLFQATSDRGERTGSVDEAGLVSQSSLLLNLGDGVFLDVSASAGLEELGDENSGVGFPDIDGDGDLDLLIDSPRSLFLNQGDGRFVPEPIDGVTWGDGIGRSLATADIDRDGDPDVWLGGTEQRLDAESQEEAQPESDGLLLRNDTQGSNWLAVELVGTQSNRDGIGARVIAVVGGQVQTRQVMSSTGVDQSDRVVHLGLGAANFVDHLEIRWPSGIVDEVDAVPAGGRVRVIEGSGVAHRSPPTTWVTAPPLAVDAGQTLAWNLRVRPSLFDSLSTVTRVAADLSALGGPAEILFNPDGDGDYHWRGSFEVTGAGPTSVDVLIEQETSLGPYWTRLSRTIEVTMAPTAVLETKLATVPSESSLGANYPNPFNSGTVIPFALDTPGQAELHIYDLLGQRVATLISGFREAGTYQLHSDATDDHGQSLASGTYFYRLLTDDGVQSRKLVLLR